MELPKITKLPSNLSVSTGEKITLECEVTGLPPPTLTWTHNGKPLDDTKSVGVSRIVLNESINNIIRNNNTIFILCQKYLTERVPYFRVRDLAETLETIFW